VCMIVCAWGGGEVGATTQGVTGAISLLPPSSSIHEQTRCTFSLALIHTHTDIYLYILEITHILTPNLCILEITHIC
jgi:hypothetical protein